MPDLKNPFVRFLTTAFALLIAWVAIYEFWLDEEDTLDILVINNLVWAGEWVLELMGYTLFEFAYNEKEQLIGITGELGPQPVWVGDECNGMWLFALFTFFVVAYPGPIRKKAWFIPVGILAIHALNVLRVVALTMLKFHNPNDPEVFDFHHNYTFQTIVYAFVFLLWYIWAERLSGERMAVTPTTDEDV